jgi:hypothetical protein
MVIQKFFLEILIRLNPGVGNGFGALYYTDLPLFIYRMLYLLLNNHLFQCRAWSRDCIMSS